MTYKGGYAQVTVSFPNGRRNVIVNHGDTIEVSSDEAKRLKKLPGWTAEKPRPATTQTEEV